MEKTGSKKSLLHFFLFYFFLVSKQKQIERRKNRSINQKIAWFQENHLIFCFLFEILEIEFRTKID
jgi:hypothetical protein